MQSYPGVGSMIDLRDAAKDGIRTETGVILPKGIVPLPPLGEFSFSDDEGSDLDARQQRLAEATKKIHADKERMIELEGICLKELVSFMQGTKLEGVVHGSTKKETTNWVKWKPTKPKW